MPFFIKGSTICKICKNPIEHLKDAVVLPYINPVEYPAFVEFVRSYIHRKCFIQWPNHKKYPEAAYHLIDKAIKEGKVYNVVYRDDLFLIFWQDYGNFYSIHDLDVMLEFEIKAADVKSFSEILSDIHNSRDINIQIGDQVIFYKNEELFFEYYRNKELIDAVRLPKERFNIWENGLTWLNSQKK
jgi:hypothetical protein